MKAKLFGIILLISNFLLAQEEAWVFFKDKPNAAVFFSNPLLELRQRSLDRRNFQGIALDITDVPIHQPYVDEIMTATGITVLAKSKWLNYVHVKGAQANIEALADRSFVDHIQYANHSLNAKMRDQGNMPFVDKWSERSAVRVNYAYGNSATQIQMLNAHFLHEQNYTGTGKIIAILDAGFPGVNTATPFASLRNKNLILGGYDFVKDSNDFYKGDSHGTNVLSTMGANTTNLVGTAPDASYYLFITEDVATEEVIELSNWVEAAEEADRLGVDVINSSLGYFSFDNRAHSFSYQNMNGQTSVASRAVDIAFSKGMICVISAGNEGGKEEPHIGTPADARAALTVGAVTSTRIRSSFSSIGPTADNRIKPDLMAMGTASVIATPTGAIITENGTSFSGPILAGAITSFWSAFPTKKNTEIVQLVRTSADRFTLPDTDYGYGIPNFQTALNNVLSIKEFELNPIKVYPNPITDAITCEIPLDSINSELRIYNNLRQLVTQKILTNTVEEINVSHLNAGVYYYIIADSVKKIQGKLIKN
ncbi:S8 family serine peptidase [Flavobacterium columnare]|uniref:S8 family serine peptidase n=1 Tax=Flavobacterium columnare TaxID=996 RepID=UPI000D1B68E8|nr:S8 family serine peptidase [Flavobacterium columnare]MBF6654172.1 peptidase S8 [Flavobacterium columnare]PTD15218.1 peptidase S8 [Flavobacterium columnare]